MAKLSKGDTSTTEMHSDAWSRFERAIDVVAKSPPQHRPPKQTKRMTPKRGKTQSSKKK